MSLCALQISQWLVSPMQQCLSHQAAHQSPDIIANRQQLSGREFLPADQSQNKASTMPPHRRRSSLFYSPSDQHWREHISTHRRRRRRSSIGIGITRRRSSARFKLNLHDSEENRSYRIVTPGVEERRPSWAHRTFTPAPEEFRTTHLYRVVSPESEKYHPGNAFNSWYTYCISLDRTYARLSARLERMRQHQGFVRQMLLSGLAGHEHGEDLDSPQTSERECEQA